MQTRGLVDRLESSTPWTRSAISLAALFVKVTARMRSGAVPRRMSSAIRSVTTRVFPPSGLSPAATDEARRGFARQVLDANPRPRAVPR